MDNLTLLCQLYGKGLETVQKLKEAGVDGIEKILENSAEKLSGITGLSLAQSRNLWDAAVEMAEGKSGKFEERLPRLKGKALKKKLEKMKRPTQLSEEGDFEFGSSRQEAKVMVESGVSKGEAEEISLSSKKPEKASDAYWRESFWRFG
ncbi:MAG: hypothetical protein AB1756_03900 [Acidobacteriota bacterium]